MIATQDVLILKGRLLFLSDPPRRSPCPTSALILSAVMDPTPPSKPRFPPLYIDLTLDWFFGEVLSIQGYGLRWTGPRDGVDQAALDRLLQTTGSRLTGLLLCPCSTSSPHFNAYYLLHTSIMRPYITYAGPVWYNQLVATPGNQLESFQHRALFPILNSFVRIPMLGGYIKAEVRQIFDAAYSSEKYHIRAWFSSEALLMLCSPASCVS
ncbi:hypothetical protein J6590_039014 [Homalodisca vitripennis]|nr:hypothetical protein J6590_039014 [Homalodisca vitripennis]